MKRKFIVEIEYNELLESMEKENPALHPVALETVIEDLMEDYIKTKSVAGIYSYTIHVTEEK